MLEILTLIFLTRKVGEIVEAKGRKSLGYKFLTVGLWIGGEIVCAVVGAIIVGLAQLPSFVIYIFALIGAALGAGIAYLIATLLTPLEIEPPPMPPRFN